MRYIDADLLLAQCQRNPLFEKTEKDKGMIYIERSIIDDTPTADVVEVRHGYWKWEKKIEPRAQNRLYCSICDNECLSKGNYYVFSTYCPNCGAKMREERKEENGT